MKSLFVLIPAVALVSGCVAYADPYGAHGYSGPGYGYGYSQPAYVHGPRDRDRDGVPNRYDRDRDGDGVRNRYDSRPNNPYRR